MVSLSLWSYQSRSRTVDDKFMACAMYAGVNFIVSGDRKHLLKLKSCQGIVVLSPYDFLAMFEHQGGQAL